MSDVFKPQRKFSSVALTTIMLMRVKANFGNQSRYGGLSEKTFSRRFRKPFDFAQFDSIGTEMCVNPHTTTMIGAADCGYVAKSGEHTYGLDKFLNGTRFEVGKVMTLRNSVSARWRDGKYSVIWQERSIRRKRFSLKRF